MKATQKIIGALWPSCPEPLFAAIAFVAGTAFPILFYLLARRARTIDFLFFPAKYVGRKAASQENEG